MSGTPDYEMRDEETPPSSMSEIPLELGEPSLPAPEEVRMSARDSSTNNNDNATGVRRRTVWYSVLCLVLVAIIVVIGVALASSGGDGGTPSSSSSGSGTGPQSSVRQFSFEQVVAYLEGEGISDQQDLLSFPTPQSQAARWLANEDPRNLSLPSEGVDSQQGYHFITRYILATIYYAMSGTKWRFQFNFLTGDDICSWRDTLYVINTGEPIPFGSMCDSTSGEIHKLYLDANSLDGTIPSEITKLTSLRELNMNFNNNVRGKLPSDIGNLSLLQRLEFSRNLLTGEIPTSICDLIFLRQLHLGYNTLNGEMPSCIGSLVNLQLLFLADNALTGLVPSSLADLTQLQMIWLDDNDLSGDVSTTFNNMPNLRTVYIEDNSLQGTIDDNFMASNRNLIQMDLSNNNFVGSIPDHFFDPEKVPLLEMLDVGHNRLSGLLPANVPPNSEMNFLALQGNSFQGPIPDSWANFEGLFHLDLSSNDLTGPMPEHLANLTRLSYLFLANNTFTAGPIPDFSALTRMEEISLKRTSRMGELPEWISEWGNLKLLDLDNNNLMGQIPESYGNLTNLQFLLLNRNNLGGEVPTTFASLTNLRAVFLDKNSMTGRLDVLCSLPSFAGSSPESGNVIAADCIGGESATIVCGCCSICCSSSFSSAGQDEGAYDEETCHDATAIASLEPIWENIYARSEYNFGNETRFFEQENVN